MRFGMIINLSTTVFRAQALNCNRLNAYSISTVHRHQRSHLSLSASSIIDAHSDAVQNKALEARINDLVNHPAVVWNATSTFASMHKKKLAHRHIPQFDRSPTTNNCDALFDEFATVVCNAGVVARKEVFETWASALYIHDFFFSQEHNIKTLRRVADIAAGHGLLAWALLILDDDYRRQRSESDLPPLTAFCLDVQMPKSAELIQTSMLERFPYLEEQFDYVEGRLEQLIPHESCLLAGVHACGTLSDVLVSTAADHRVPLALVPCCHSRKAKVLEACASRFAKKEYEAILNTQGKIPDLANRLDAARITALRNSGMDVVEASIPNLFTDKNRLIMATPGQKTHLIPNDATNQMNVKSTNKIQRGQMPPLNTINDNVSINPKDRFMKGFSVPCKDDKQSRVIISKISGRIAAERRKEVMHNRKHHQMPQLDLSLWLPDDGSEITEQSMQKVIKRTHPNINSNVTMLGGVYLDPKTGRRAQTYRIQYGVDDEVLSFDEANKAHKILYHSIPLEFPGAKCR
ncbi:hypothetical protein ACHAXN_002159 [Cyclotella atomus]